MIKKLYPEIVIAGGLVKALNLSLEKNNSSFLCIENNLFGETNLTSAILKNKNHSSQIYIASEKKLYLFDFWENGVCLGFGKINDIHSLTRIIDYWLRCDLTIKDLIEKYSFISANDIANSYYDNKEVEYQWNKILKDDYITQVGLIEFVELAIKDEILSKLFPFTSMTTLRFSRCTGFPYTNDTPTVTPIGNKSFKVNSTFEIDNDENYLGKGTAIEVLKIVKNNLPYNISPAVKGTANDCKLDK